MLLYIKHLLIALDQFINAMLGGWPDETLSSRAWRMSLAGGHWLCEAIDFMAGLFGDYEHCRKSYESERLGRQRPPELRRFGI